MSTALFAIFGVRMLREGLRMSPDEGQEELEEVQAEIKKKDEEVNQMLLYSNEKKTIVKVEKTYIAREHCSCLSTSPSTFACGIYAVKKRPGFRSMQMSNSASSLSPVGEFTRN